MPAFTLRLCAVLFLLSVTAARAEPPTMSLPGRIDSSAGALQMERLASLEYPWGLAVLPDGRVLVTEKPGRLRIWDRGQLSPPVQGLPRLVYRGTPYEQGGLLDVAADPQFDRNGWIYLAYVEAATVQVPEIGEPGDQRFGDYIDYTDTLIRGGAVARARLDGRRLRDLRVIWRQAPKTVGRGHFGHRLLFAPDGMLFITSGDRMQFDPAQRLASNLGKIVRIRPDGSLPEDNPFLRKAGARGDLWSIGHRNILAAAFDPASNRLWAFEMGPLGGDELNLIEPGRNYGWPLVSNGDHYAGPSIPDHPARPAFVAPVRTWTPVISPSGALFYGGSRFQGWGGSAIVGSLSARGLVRLVFADDQVLLEERITLGQRVRDLAEAPDGTLLILTDERNGSLLRLAPAATP